MNASEHENQKNAFLNPLLKHNPFKILEED